MTDAAHAADDHPHVNYMAKFWWLLGLTIAEVALAIFLQGKEGLQGVLFLSLSVLALWKAGIVLNYFMHMKEEGRALKLAMCFPLVLIIILFLAFITDSHWLKYAQGY